MNEPEILEFINLQIKSGATNKQIKEFLIKEKVSEENIDRYIEEVRSSEIKEIIEEAKEDEQVSIKPQINTLKYWFIFLGMMLLILFIIILYVVLV